MTHDSPDTLPPAASGALWDSSLSLIEFGKLLDVVAGYAHSDSSRKSVLDIRPLGSREEIEKRLGQIGELERMAQEGGPIRLWSFSDIAPLIAGVRPEGAVLEGRELAGFIAVLGIISGIAAQLAERDDLPLMAEFRERLTGFPSLLRSLEKSLDSEGAILDSASLLLADLRERVRRLEGRIRKKLEEMVRDEATAVFLQDSFITTRSGRWVIPVRMDAKGQVPGVVHDVSKSGETAFIEPLHIINIVNELENLKAEQKAEEIRILRVLSAGVRAEAEAIYAQYEIVVYLDTLNCIVCLSEALHMRTPEINEEGFIRLKGARHPLLTLALQRSGNARQVVPLTITLGGDDTVMVITGSNAGGKTIAIKTIGLLLCMALSGMPVPADSSCSFPLVHGLLIDMGDEQSIENNLSTFSAHVENISAILKGAGQGTLALIDELGTGTDPVEGAALACAVLKELKGSRALVFATTHLTDIKGFVHRTGGMLNASMEFDNSTFTPLYRLRIGEPGQSHALEIARKYGLPDSIIDSAKGMLGGVKVEFDNLIADLNEKRARYERELDDLHKRKAELEAKSRLLGTMLAEAEEKQKEMLAKAYGDAAEVVASVKREMYALLEEAKKKEREKGREAIRQAERMQEEVTAKLREYEGTADSVPPLSEIKEGDVVFVRSLGYDAPVVEVSLRHNRLRVRAGGKDVEVPAGDIGAGRGKPVQEKSDRTFQQGRADEAVESRINLVGARVDEALSRVEPFLNHAALDGLSEVVIIHGLGAGILMRAVREHLDGHPLVKTFRSGEQKEGGSGVTIVTLA